MKKTVLILDDIALLPNLIEAKIHNEFANQVSVVCLSNEAELRTRLESSSPRETVLMVNAAFKPHPSAARCEFAGVRRIIKRAVRLTWLNQTPVIAYCTIPVTDFWNLSVGRIFQFDPSHSYIDIARLGDESLRRVLESVSPVSDIKALQKLISEFCPSELSDLIKTALHLLRKTYKLSSKEEKHEFIDCLKHLQRILDPAIVDRFLLVDLNRTARDIAEGENSSLVRKKIASIRDRLEELSQRLVEEEASR